MINDMRGRVILYGNNVYKYRLDKDTFCKVKEYIDSLLEKVE